MVTEWEILNQRDSASLINRFSAASEFQLKQLDWVEGKNDQVTFAAHFSDVLGDNLTIGTT